MCEIKKSSGGHGTEIFRLKHRKPKCVHCPSRRGSRPQQTPIHTLYSSASSKEEMDELKVKIKELLVTANSQAEVEKVTPDIVKQAAMLMKRHKMDVSQGFSSDALLHAPDQLFSLLAVVFQDWLIHGTVTRSLLACAFIPLLKSSKDPSNTDSYRAIASSSLILKLFERCTLLIWGDQLHSDSLQFGFKQRCSTGTATWLVQEVLRQKQLSIC